MNNFYEEHAQLLYDLAKSHGHLEDVYQDIQVFKDGVGGEMPFTQMMSRENVPNSSKAAFLNEICQYFLEETQQFFQFFIREARFDYIYRAVKRFETIYHTHHLDITTAVALTKEQMATIVSGVSKKMDREIDTYQNIVDEKVLGGVKVQSNEFIIDDTLLAKLDAFKETI